MFLVNVYFPFFNHVYDLWETLATKQICVKIKQKSYHKNQIEKYLEDHYIYYYIFICQWYSLKSLNKIKI